MNFDIQRIFTLSPLTKYTILNMKPDFGFGDFSEFVFNRTYARRKNDGSRETWADVVIRVTEGTFNIRKDWYTKNGINWDEDFWQDYARGFAISMFNMEWLPAGRGLWAMGTDYIYRNGSMSLNNCGFTTLENKTLANDFDWLMDALMCGVGVGFRPDREDDLIIQKNKKKTLLYTIPDTRFGWCNSVKLKIDSFLNTNIDVCFDYNQIRGKGELIRGFGGIASGPEPLIKLHEQIDCLFFNYNGDSVKLKTDIANLIGCAVVSGNVRRSAELALLPISDPTFINLKDYNLYPERAEYGWMSNNSVTLYSDSDFLKLKDVAERVIYYGEPGIINLRNLPLGRLWPDDSKPDKAIGFNPCGEQPLENKEVCNLAETLPTRGGYWFQSCEYATCYASSVNLLPTHRPETNSVMLRNRRIGVSIVDVSGWDYNIGTTQLITNLRKGYKRVRETNDWLNDEAGVPRSIRVTTIKPGGSTPKIAGKTGGFSWPTFHYTLMRVKVSSNETDLCQILDEANVPFENDIYEGENTRLYEFPVIQGPAPPATKISLWQQATMLMLLQRHWSDNAVSNTLYFKPRWKLIAYGDCTFNGETKVVVDGKTFLKDYFRVENYGGVCKVYEYDENHEEDQIEKVLAAFMPMVKSLSLLPHTSDGVYKQMPQSGLTYEQYMKRLDNLRCIDWQRLTNMKSEPEKYCMGDKCTT